MPRCVSPTVTVDVVYALPGACMARSPTLKRPLSPLRRAPPAPRQDSGYGEDDDVMEEEEAPGRTHTTALPSLTGNQWSRASTPFQSTLDLYPTQAERSSYESQSTVISSVSSTIRKKKRLLVCMPRRREQAAVPSTSSSSSSASSMNGGSYASSSDETPDLAGPVFSDASPPPHSRSVSGLKKHWAALSLRVRFGLFRAKRRIRDRGLTL